MKKTGFFGLLGIFGVIGIMASSPAVFAGGLAANCASYQVPAASTELAPYSMFQVTKLDSTLVNGQRLVKYLLPQQLTGEPMEVSFSGPANQPDPDQLSGPQGTMNCANDVCQVKFHDLALDDGKVDQFLHSLNLSDSELALRTQVARTFKKDPGGVFTYSGCGF